MGDKWGRSPLKDLPFTTPVPALQSKISAADILKEMIPFIEGRGGGKADMA